MSDTNSSNQPVLGSVNQSVPPPDGGDPRVSLFEYLSVVYRRRTLFLSILLVGGLLATAILLIMPETYVAGAILLPPDKSEGGVSLTSIVQSSKSLDFAGLSENASAETLAKMITSRSVADSLITRFDLMKRYDMEPFLRPIAIDAVLANFDVTADRQGFISVRFAARTDWFPTRDDETKTRALVSKVVNASIELLDHMNREKNIGKARRSREFLGIMRIKKRKELDSLQMRMQVFQKANKAYSISDQAQVSLDALIMIQTEINKKEIEIASAETEYQGGPILQRLRSQLELLKKQKSQMESGNLGTTRTGFPLSGVPELMRQYVGLKLDLEVATQVYTFIETQYHHEAVQEARDLPTVQVLDEATPPVFRSSPKRTFLLSIALVVLAIIGVVVVFIAERMSSSLKAYRGGWRGAIRGERPVEGTDAGPVG